VKAPCEKGGKGTDADVAKEPGLQKACEGDKGLRSGGAYIGIGERGKSTEEISGAAANREDVNRRPRRKTGHLTKKKDC